MSAGARSLGLFLGLSFISFPTIVAAPVNRGTRRAPRPIARRSGATSCLRRGGPRRPEGCRVACHARRSSPATSSSSSSSFVVLLLGRPARRRRELGRRHRRGPRALRFTRGGGLVLAVLEPPPRVQEPLLRQGRPRREAESASSRSSGDATLKSLKQSTFARTSARRCSQPMCSASQASRSML